MSTQTSPEPAFPVVIIGAGPVGLAAAAHLQQRGEPFLVVESGPTAGAAVLEWAHVRMFSPWTYNTDPASVALLRAIGWIAPRDTEYPTGGDLVTHYVAPLAQHPLIAPHVRYGARVVGVGRRGLDRTKTTGRETAPFSIHIAGVDGQENELLARAVIDASGTWRTPNPLGTHGYPARGEALLGDDLAYGMPDVLGRVRARYAGRRVLVVGSGHSAMNVLLDLAELAHTESATQITWAVRRASISGIFGGGDRDQLAERGRLGKRVQALVESGQLQIATAFGITRLSRTSDGIVASDGVRDLPPVDRVVAATGFRPDLDVLRELRIDLDAVVESPRALAPLIDPNIHSCGTVPPHGALELQHPEQDFYIVGMKSYGRAPTFLLRTGYEQVRSVVCALVGDREGARRVELTLPETGVCSTNRVLTLQSADACCGPASPSVGPSSCC